MSLQSLVAYGDFNDPWCYLASRRLAALTSHYAVDWRAVERPPLPQDGPCDVPQAQFAHVLTQMPSVHKALLNDERFPYALAGFLPNSGAAVCAYAEACSLGEGLLAREVLFEGFWIHSIDLDDYAVVSTVVNDAIGSRTETDLRLRSTPDTHPSRTTLAAQRLRFAWAAEWIAFGRTTLPALRVGDQPLMFGREVLDWLAGALTQWGVDVSYMPEQRTSDVMDCQQQAVWSS